MPRKSQPRKVRENNVNPLFTQWLKEWRDEAASKNSNAKHTYSRALQSLNKFPLPLKSGKECNILKNFGQKICDLLDKKLEEHRRLHPDFDENASVPIIPPSEKPAKRAPKVRNPASSADQQPGPSQSRVSAQTNGSSDSRAKTSLKVQAKPALKPLSKSISKPSAMTSLKVNKPYAKIPRVRTTARKSNGGSASQRPRTSISQPPAPSPSPPVVLSPEEISLLQFSLDNLDIPSTAKVIGEKREVIDLSQHVDSPEPAADVDSLLTLTERLLARSSAENEVNGDVVINGKCDKVVDDDDDDDDDCVVVMENLGPRSDRPPNESPEEAPGKISPFQHRSLLEHILDDSSMDCDEEPRATELTEDSFMDLLPKPAKPSAAIADSVLDVAAAIRRKRKSFLDKLASQAIERSPGQSEAQLPSFFSSPSNSAICVEAPRDQPQNGTEVRDLIEVDVPREFIPDGDNSPPSLDVVIVLPEESEDSEDDILVPLSRRLRADKVSAPPEQRAPQARRSPPAPPTPRNDSFAQLLEDFETPPASRVVKPTENVDVQVAEPESTRKRKKAKQTIAADGDAVPKKRARKNKEKPPPAPTVPARAFDLRYVPEGSRLPSRVPASIYNGDSPSKCPRKISLKPGTFDIILCVDNCEATGGVNTKKKEAMVQALQSSGINMEIRKINVGDFAWIARSGDQELVLDCVVERKRTDDLASSIKDGRYAEQKHRLITSGIKRKIYLIEEFNRFATGGITDQALLQAQLNTQVISDFIVKQTKNTKESARYLTTLTRALEVKYKNLHLRSCLKEEAQMFENHLMSWQEFNDGGYKRKKVCTREMFIRALMVVRSMSLERALTITTVYPTVTALLEAFDGCDEVRHKDKLLADLRCPISGRRIGPALSKVLKQMFVDGHSDEQS